MKDTGFKLRTINSKTKFIKVCLNMPFSYMSRYFCGELAVFYSEYRFVMFYERTRGRLGESHAMNNSVSVIDTFVYHYIGAVVLTDNGWVCCKTAIERTWVYI